MHDRAPFCEEAFRRLAERGGVTEFVLDPDADPPFPIRRDLDPVQVRHFRYAGSRQDQRLFELLREHEREVEALRPVRRSSRVMGRSARTGQT